MQCIPRAISEKLLRARRYKINKIEEKQVNLKARVFQVCVETKNVKDKKIHNKQDFLLFTNEIMLKIIIFTGQHFYNRLSMGS